MTEPTPRWGLGDVAIGLVPFALVAVAVLAGDGDDGEITIDALVANSVLLWVFLIGVPLFATMRKGRGPVVDLGLRFRPADAGAVALGAAIQAVAVPALYWPLFRLTELTSDDVSGDARELVDAASGPGVVVLVLVVCAGAPFAEELFFRGLLLRATERRWGVAVALVASTVIFAVTHVQGVQLPALVLFGAVAGWLTVRTGRLGPSIALHVGFNAWTVLHLLVIDPS